MNSLHHDFSHLTFGQTGNYNPFLDDNGQWRKGAINPWIDSRGNHKLDKLRPWSEQRGEWHFDPTIPYMGKSGQMTMDTWKIWYEGKDKFMLNIEGNTFLSTGHYWSQYPIRPDGLNEAETKEFFALPKEQRGMVLILRFYETCVSGDYLNVRNTGPERPAHMGEYDGPEKFTHAYYEDKLDKTVEKRNEARAKFEKFYGPIPRWV